MLLAGPIFHTSTQYIDFVEILSVSLDLSTIYFVYFSGCFKRFTGFIFFCVVTCFCCHSIPECCVMFSGVKLRRSSVLLQIKKIL